MKTRSFLFMLTLVFCFTLTVNAQNKDAAKKEKSITWYGIDFTRAKFTLVTEDPSVIVNQYLKSINQLIQMEPEKFDFKKWFIKSDVKMDLDQVNEKNAKISTDNLVISDDYKMDADEVKKVLAGYKTSGNPGLGLIFIAENLHKVKQTGSFYVVFFNQETKEIVDSERFEVKAVGIGFRNYWAGAVYNIMKIWLK